MNFRTLLATAALAVAPLLSQPVFAEFDPVHEDIDIFMANPAIESERPNVLIILDTTANWNTYFTSEKESLVSVVNGLTDQFNVGLMLFTGGSIEGSYVRYAIRQMTETNKSQLSGLVNDLNNAPATTFTGDKTNNGVPGQAMVEAYRYFGGLSSYSASTHSEHDPRTDYNGNASNTWITSLAGNAFPGTPAVASNYTSPVADGCQRNFIIYISNGKGSNQVGEKTNAKNELSSALGSTATAITPLSPTGNETDSWFDEWAQFFAKTGFTMTVDGASRTIYAQTYVVEINPGSQSADEQWSATLESATEKGDGAYYAISPSSGEEAAGGVAGQLTKALNDIFNEIQAVNSVFASTTLPVSVNVRGTNLNQVYIGMFRPDADKAPRWFGNLKMYKLALIGDQLKLVDANTIEAESQTTGFIKESASSFWTHSSNFWDFRTDEENGQGGSSDSPDGNLVEKGAVAQALREEFETDQNVRRLYTCTSACDPCTVAGSGTSKTCSNSSDLDGTLFSTSNADITAASLGLGTKEVSPLTAKITRSLATATDIKDRRDVALSNTVSTPLTITAASNGAVSRDLSAMSAFDGIKTTAITTLNGSSTTASISIGKGSVSSNTVTLKFAKGSMTANPCNGKETVAVVGNHGTINGNWTITSASNTTSTYGSGANATSAYSVTFIVPGSPNPNDNGTFTCTGKSQTVTATVAALPAGLAVNSRINISGASPTAFNGDFTVNSVGTNSFTYTIPSLQGLATTPGTLKVYNTVDNAGNYSAATATFLRVKATTSAAHSFAPGSSVIVSGVTPSAYNGTYAVKTSATPNLTIDVPIANYPLEDATAFGTVYAGATTTVTITTSANHGFSTGDLVDVSGLDACFNVAATPITYVSATQFTYVTASACAPLASIPAAATASGSTYATTVTATLASHGFNTGDQVTIDDGTVAAHNGTFSVTGTTANTFTYEYTGACPCVGPAGQYTVRLASNPLAYVTVSGHGFTNGDEVTIAGANPVGYNLTTVASGTPASSANLMVIDANTFTYPLSAAVGTNTSESVTVSKNTTTARAHSVAHGFADGTSIIISGATPTAFNGTFTIKTVGTDDFIYCLNAPTHDFSVSASCAASGTTAGDASGTILATAGGGTDSERNQLIAWVRGANNAKTTGNEDTTAADTACRATVHGDVLHSRPAVINYNRYGGDNDVYVFYGANDGVFRAVKGGVAKDTGDPTNLESGDEAWGFIPTEGFNSLKRLRNNSPLLSSDFKKPYFMDGPIGVYSMDGDGDGEMNASTAEDDVFIYIGARRGGRYIYSLDVTDPEDPKYRWKIDSTSTGFGELGYTWSQPTVVSDIEGYVNPVLIFGGGYDPDVEDIENCTITAANATSVTYNKGTISFNSAGTGCTVTGGVSTTVTRSMGRAIYVVDAITGELVWWAGPTGSGADLEVSGMDYAIPSDVTIVKNLSGGLTNRGYVGDTGGNLWRLDFSGSNTANWKVTKIASISNLTTMTDGYLTGYRKFTNPPDVVGDTGFDAILIGSGDREHPFDNTVVNRFYMFKDHGNDTGPGTGTTYFFNDTDADGTGDTAATTIRTGSADGAGNPVITHNPAIAADGQLVDVTTTAPTDAGIAAADGWFFTLDTGEKVIGNAIALNGVAFFNTNQPSQTADSSCVANLGIARQYQVTVAKGLSPDYQEGDNVTLASRSTIHMGGGFLPSPVHVVVQVPDENGEMVTVEGVISGTSVQTPEQGAVGSRSRRFWYKEIDE